jgi:glutamyl-tRNA synthetase/glutamyl-Q tRNA(Asp) synthetase
MNSEYPFTRFAPSPTGYLHRGHILSALCVYAAAEKYGYRVRLRIEDHDQSRARQAYIDAIREDLEWLGFTWEAESIQSANTERYERLLEKLRSKDLIYACNCSRKFTFETNPTNSDGEIIYQGHCQNLGLPFTKDHAIRFKTPNASVEWEDLLLGKFVEKPTELCGDFALKDRIGQWTYQFAVVADDFEEGVGLVVRGEDLKHSTSRQIVLAQALGRNTPPLFLHHPLIVDPTGKKLSKREHAASIRGERDAGKSAEALLGEVCAKAGLIATPRLLSVKDSIQLVKNRLF